MRRKQGRHACALRFSRVPRTPKRKSTTSVQYLVINQPFYIAVRHNDFTVIAVPYFTVCLIPRYFFVYQYLLLARQAPVSGHLSPTPLVAPYENHSSKRPAPVTDIFIAYRGCPLTRASTVLTNQVSLYGRILTSVVCTAFGLYLRPQSRFSHTDLLLG